MPDQTLFKTGIFLWAAGTLAALFFLMAVVVVVFRLGSYFPAPIEDVDVVNVERAPVFDNERPLKVVSWNIQYLAGKNYVFFYDTPDFDGPDERPSREDIEMTLEEVARVLKAEDPDVIFLQEVDEGSKRTDYEDQRVRLMELLGSEWGCFAEAFYHRSFFVPHPRIMGAVGLKLVTLSKYRLSGGRRYQLPTIPASWYESPFILKRALLEVEMETKDGLGVVLLNTHFDAFAQGHSTMAEQVEATASHLSGLETKGRRWILGGDMNLLPPGQFQRLGREEFALYFRPKSEMGIIYDQFKVIPSLEVLGGEGYAAWFTHFPNAEGATGPDKTIDYLVYSRQFEVVEARVRSEDTLRISDHLPLVARFSLTGGGRDARNND